MGVVGFGSILGQMERRVIRDSTNTGKTATKNRENEVGRSLDQAGRRHRHGDPSELIMAIDTCIRKLVRSLLFYSAGT
ncbi:MAG: hypothetical protein RQ899_14915 [Pseudomonadales bacterium]|nr:hypothetical protein [Pseudomonadales bacterium]